MRSSKTTTGDSEPLLSNEATEPNRCKKNVGSLNLARRVEGELTLTSAGSVRSVTSARTSVPPHQRFVPP